jgi:hypothetical protein
MVPGQPTYRCTVEWCNRPREDGWPMCKACWRLVPRWTVAMLDLVRTELGRTGDGEARAVLWFEYDGLLVAARYQAAKERLWRRVPSWRPDPPPW